MFAEDHPATTQSQPMLDPPQDLDSQYSHTAIFDPDHTISQSLLTQLASATSVTSTELCRRFIRTGTILTSDGKFPIRFNRFLLDTGAQGSDFISVNTRCHHLAFAAKVEKQLQATVSIQ